MRAFYPWTLVGVLLVGCSGTDPGQGIVNRREPVYVRYLNLSASPINGYVGNETRSQALAPDSMSIGSIVSLSKQKFGVERASGRAETLVKPTPGNFLTVVDLGKGAPEVVVGGPCRNPDHGGRIEVANFSAVKVDCEVSGKRFALGPQSSEFVDVPKGSYDVSSKDANSESIAVAEKEIWTVYYIPAAGKLTAKILRVKGPMKASLAGSSASH